VILTCLGIHENYEIANSAWHQLEGHAAKFWDRHGREENCPDENVVYMQPDFVIQDMHPFQPPCPKGLPFSLIITNSLAKVN
jgi:hypothetical protein